MKIVKHQNEINQIGWSITDLHDTNQGEINKQQAVLYDNDYNLINLYFRT